MRGSQAPRRDSAEPFSRRPNPPDPPGKYRVSGGLNVEETTVRTIRRFVTATTISALIAAGLVSVPLAAHAAGTTYYVSSSGGSDTNPGTSSDRKSTRLNSSH